MSPQFQVPESYHAAAGADASATSTFARPSPRPADQTPHTHPHAQQRGRDLNWIDEKRGSSFGSGYEEREWRALPGACAASHPSCAGYSNIYM